MIRPYLRDLINEHKPTVELNNTNSNNNTNNSNNNIKGLIQIFHHTKENGKNLNKTIL